ncbi:unnamed protein product [Tuber aestivum]|uniref:Uncharacterized protein n=1 Tax=Tuber aestivum TaxID=59557 RepID=A0A292PI55_9PEZI|nr:unnamed protein product [Tuber aestivum]
MNDKLNRLSEIGEGKLLKEQEQFRRELAKRRKEELVGRAEGREDAIQDQGGGYESSSSAMAALLALRQARASEYEAEHGGFGGESNSDSDSEMGIPDLESKSTGKDIS